MKELSCGIARDLLPLYAEGLLGQESREALEHHLPGCEGCRLLLEGMKAGPAVAPEAVLPLKSMADKLRRERRRLALLVAALLLFAGTVLLARLSERHYLPYQREAVQITREADGSLLITAALPAQIELTQGGRHPEDAEKPSFYVSLYNLEKGGEGSAQRRLSLPAGTNPLVYYASPGREAVLLYGEAEDDGHHILLQRLVLNYYLVLAGALCLLLSLLALLLRSRRGLFLRLLCFPLGYLLAQLAIKGLDGSSWNALRDFLFIASAGLFGAAALWLGANRWLRKKVATKA